MPQLIPFYFVNQVFFVYLVIVVSLYLLSKYMLPFFISLFMSRISINKL